MSDTQLLNPPAPVAALPWGLAWRLAAGQIVSWGILYYAFTVVVGPMQVATGWSRPFLNAGLSLGLLTWGVCALPAGAWIQRHGARGLMAWASLLGGGALALLALSAHPVVYLVAWLLLGVAMAGSLYEPAFAVITQHFGSEYRRGITFITLVGGLASTLFIPLCHHLVGQFGWRAALISLAILQAVVVTPLYARGLPRFNAPTGHRENQVGPQFRLTAWWRELRRDLSDPRFIGLTFWFTAHAAAFSGFIFQLMPILQEAGVPPATVLGTMALIGPMQVIGRLLLGSGSARFSTLGAGAWAMGGLGTAMLVLLAFPLSAACLVAFAVLFGAGNGMMTILRGTAVAEIFGRSRYAELNGALALPAVLARAASPFVLASLWSITGHSRMMFAGMLALTLLGWCGLLVARRAQNQPIAPAAGFTRGSFPV